MPRGTQRMRQWEDERIAERDAQPVTVRCAHCKWFTEGTLGESRQAHAQHRAKHHPEIIPPKRHRRHRFSSQFSREKTLDDNIAAVRSQGGATWDGATL